MCGFHGLNTLIYSHCHIFNMTALYLPCQRFQVQYLAHFFTLYIASTIKEPKIAYFKIAYDRRVMLFRHTWKIRFITVYC